LTPDLLAATVRSIQAIDHQAIDRMADTIENLRDDCARLFIIGCGGGAAHASHACADFRKLCRVEAYCPSDNVAELTARVNDDGWETAYQEWLRGSRISENDALLVVSVGGGSFHPPVSVNLVYAVDLAIERGAAVLAIVGRDGGHAKRYAHTTVLVPCDVPELVTFVVEGIQAVVLHALVSKIAVKPAKWESLAKEIL
jgi:D-sedoheptulose 7-phosphate isomerase